MSKKYGAQTHGTSPLLLRGGGIAKRGTGQALRMALDLKIPIYNLGRMDKKDILELIVLI